MKKLVIGTGFLGRTLVSHLLAQGVPVMHTYRTEQHFPDSLQLDLLQKQPSQAVALQDIDTVIFCSHVENMQDVDELVAAMSKAFADCARKRVVYISTDAVFDGTKGSYVETDAATPITAYGKNKKKCEEAVTDIVPDSCIIRPSYIYGYAPGSSKGRLETVRQALARREPVKKFVNMFKSPVEVHWLSKMILTIAASDCHGVIHAAAERVSVYDFFRRTLDALHVDTGLLRPDTLPQEAPIECLGDTSLGSSRLGDFGVQPLTLEQGIREMKRFTR